MTSLAHRLDAGEVLHLPCKVSHARRGEIRHAFTYGVDYVMLAPDRAKSLALLSFNRFNLFSWYQRDHGGLRGKGEGSKWAWTVLEQAGLQPDTALTLALMAQPRFLGYWFNPVSFWMVLRGEDLVAVIAEVNNTFGQRHSYLCHRPGFAAITGADQLVTTKVFHVSPFQDVAGTYAFRFQMGDDRVAVHIGQINENQGMNAAMSGPVRRLTNLRLLAAFLRRPGGALRIVALIYWNALRLKLKGAAYRPLPTPPENEVS